MRKIIVKEGPIVFMRNVFTMEIIACLFFFAVSFLGNYELLYKSLNLHDYIRFDIFEVLAFSVFQLIYITVLFLDWYFSHFEILEKEIVRKSGLIFRRKKSVSLADVASVEIYQSPLGRMMSHATIILEHSNSRVTKLKNVSNFDEYVHVIKQLVQSASGRVLTKDPKVLIEEGEGLFVEFKETLRYDARKGEISKELERMVVKTIVGFLNADGGTLMIGVNDDGRVTGLENDYKTLPKKSRDGFENHMTMLVKTMIGLSFTKYVSVAFEVIDGKDICLVTVREGHKPAYLTNGDKKEDFYVRVGNSTQPYSMSEASEYIKTHWE
ncbi:MAG: RNA-binding domain-containing protein [Patescibacteria group bacterium]